MSSFSPWPAFEKKVHKIQERFGYIYSKKPWIGMSAVDNYIFSLS
jgi:hypothetical protein